MPCMQSDSCTKAHKPMINPSTAWSRARSPPQGEEAHLCSTSLENANRKLHWCDCWVFVVLTWMSVHFPHLCIQRISNRVLAIGSSIPAVYCNKHFQTITTFSDISIATACFSQPRGLNLAVTDCASKLMWISRSSRHLVFTMSLLQNQCFDALYTDVVSKNHFSKQSPPKHHFWSTYWPWCYVSLFFSVCFKYTFTAFELCINVMVNWLCSHYKVHACV